MIIHLLQHIIFTIIVRVIIITLVLTVQRHLQIQEDVMAAVAGEIKKSPLR
ncbi:histidine kinase [Acinetobacter lactucae]|uniref:histidine kinase n=1 Tax=Acinetobacter lactucae TaxID=1785128 RepID=UPI001F0B5D57|nr:histidine kinase [Acinetobacter lactucae]